MRRALLVVLAVTVVLSGCGSSSLGSPANPLTTELSYFPGQSPFVLTLQTKAGSQTANAVQGLERKLPLLGFGRAAALARLQQLGINYQRDIQPLLGNPIAFGDTGASLSGFGQQYLVAWVTHDAGKLSALVAGLHGLQEAGTQDGAKLYRASGVALALAGPTLLLARTQAAVIAALGRHAHSQGIGSGQYAATVSGLDQNATMDVFGSLTSALSTPSAAKARRIPWVAALRSYVVSVSATASGLTLKFRLNTDASSLAPAQLPIAGGSSSPSLVSGLPIQVGIRDPAQIVSFAEAAEQSSSPQSYAKFLKEQATIRRKTGVDVNQLVGQLSGDLTVDSDTHTTLLRAGVGNAATVASVLSKLASEPDGLGKGRTLKRLGGGIYSFVANQRTALLGVVGDDLVLGVPPKGGATTPAALKSFAGAPSAPAAGASGAVLFRLSLSELIALTAKRAPSAAAQQLLALLGDLTGSMSATPAALTGTATLGVKSQSAGVTQNESYGVGRRRTTVQ